MDLAYESSYPTPASHSPLLPLLLLSLASQKQSPSTTKIQFIQKNYDYIIVGAGSAGSVVANRLSEIPCVSVLLLEAGKSPPRLTDVPVYASSFYRTDIDWNYTTVPQQHTERLLNNRQVLLARGKALGGSSILNAMQYVRGNRHNYDSWAAGGATGWSYTDINQYFLKMEDNKNAEFLADGFHGSGGYLTVEQSAYEPEIKRSLLKSVKNLGFQVVDSNGYRQTGVYDLQADLRNQQRCSTAKAYLVPAENRTNLNILKNAFVTKIIIKNKKAVGVIFKYNNKNYKVQARREVIVSAGAINTPQLLMLSGIGPREELQKFGIKVEADLPVGKNLQDHCYAIMPFAYSRNYSTKTEKLQDQNYIKQYIYNRTGFLPSTVGTLLLAFLNTKDVNSSVDNPNVQLYLSETTTSQSQNMNTELYEQVYKPYIDYPAFQCGVTAVQPKSRGTITLQSANPFDPPLIDPNYLEKDEDIEDIVEGMKICKDICTSQIMQDEVGAEAFTTLYPGCEDVASDENEYFKCMAKAVCLTIYHQVGTAKMGSSTDPSTVVDAQLRVKGIKNLRVVDASIMPTITSGNTNVPTMMIGEKASDMIKETLWLHK